jgi:DNA-nicking Smr family endonuclease
MELDLHGMTVETAHKALTKFLADCCLMNRKCVRIIHGKGHGSDKKMPILKNKLNQWLRQHDDIIAFCSAQPNDGGTGAVYVLIKRH